MALALSWALAPFKRLFGRRRAEGVPQVLMPDDPLPAGADYDDRSLPTEEFVLVQRMTRLMTLDEIERHLPEILGRALARGWIDKPFQAAFMDHPKKMLSTYDVHLPDSVEIEVETEPGKRPRIVVYQAGLDGRKRRLLYLQLVMMAGR
ncbi:hypothetical protein HJ526_02890 [Donghicola sp. C2-DW-16]|uniref:Uncharacterized protein n=1 Tax=Donghicola mangrovi TaxID=2729614 RepID=A0A850PZ92_9RHOB|nr:hypothetical protein [Donghicola mangrovi]NVO22054.1 hypothetical protein [Donghicola mangrovi]NVO26355.1 hypothetical protein [Donghicola mangrovi]